MFGIYCYIDNTNNEIVYIGKDSHIDQQVRHKAHTLPSRYNDQQINKVIQNNPTRYDYVELIKFDYTPSNEEFNQLEIKHITTLNPKFNFTKGGDGLFGYKHSEETKHKMSKAQVGEKNHRYGKPPWNKGKTNVYSEETLKKMSDARKGKNYGLVGKNHPSYGKKPWNNGKKWSDEVKQKISESHKGKKLSEETKQKLSEKLSGENNPNWGKHHSEETKQKIRDANLGNKHSKNTKIQMSATRNTTGFYGVHKKTNNRVKQGFEWCYQYRDENNKKRSISSVDFNKLESKVKKRGLEWFILDDEKAKQTLNEVGGLNND